MIDEVEDGSSNNVNDADKNSEFRDNVSPLENLAQIGNNDNGRQIF